MIMQFLESSMTTDKLRLVIKRVHSCSRSHNTAFVSLVHSLASACRRRGMLIVVLNSFLHHLPLINVWYTVRRGNSERSVQKNVVEEERRKERGKRLSCGLSNGLGKYFRLQLR